jgi:hypothetical protein
MDIETVKANRARLVAALRSGEYRQTQGFISDAQGFCCLGVAACILAGSRDRQAMAKFVDIGMYGDLWGVLNTEGAEAFGLVSRFDETHSHSRGQRILSQMNDNGASFNQIADFIEKTLPLPPH